jgi:hypothetical protein
MKFCHAAPLIDPMFQTGDRHDTCPVPPDRIREPMWHAAKACHAESILTVRYHPHPWMVNSQESEDVHAVLDEGTRVGLFVCDDVWVDRTGEVRPCN